MHRLLPTDDIFSQMDIFDLRNNIKIHCKTGKHSMCLSDLSRDICSEFYFAFLFPRSDTAGPFTLGNYATMRLKRSRTWRLKTK